MSQFDQNGSTASQETDGKHYFLQFSSFERGSLKFRDPFVILILEWHREDPDKFRTTNLRYAGSGLVRSTRVDILQI